VRPVYRARRDATIAALGELLPEVRHQGAAGGLHVHVTLPPGVDEEALARTAAARGVLVEEAARHWADPAQAPPSLVLGYGQISEPAIRRGIAILAGAISA
jgi:GntR family transcriptional regulator/MocR family aminotransferase